MSALALAAAPNVVAMSNLKQPDPLTPPACDLRDYPYMPLDVMRLRDSAAAGMDDAEAFRAFVLSWCVAWHQVPAASLPNDDGALCRLLGYGRDMATWMRVRASGALHGYILCADGRLYHPVVAEKANEAWQKKLAWRERSRKGNEARWGPKGGRGAEQAENFAQASGDDPTEILQNSKPSPSSIPKGSQGKGRVKGEGENSAPSSEGAAARGAAQQADLLPEDRSESIRRKLFDEGDGILTRLEESLTRDKRRDLIGALASAHGKGAEGGTRAVQVLRDVEAGVASGKIVGNVEKYLRGVIHSAKQAAARGGAARGGGTVDAVQAELARRRAGHVAAQSGIPPAAGQTIDHDPEEKSA